MTATLRIAGLTMAALAMGGADGCKKDDRDPGRSPRMEGTSMTVQTDLEKLRKRLNLPPGDFPCRWVAMGAVPGGGSGLPGPTDTRTYAFVELDGAAWSKVLPASNPGARATMEILAAVAQAVLPPAALATARKQDGHIEITGTAIPGEPLGHLPHRVSEAIRVSDGLLVALFTM